MAPIATLLPTTTTNLVRDDELTQHIEDEIKVNAIRGGRLVEVYWNELTEAEQRAARESFLQTFESGYYC